MLPSGSWMYKVIWRKALCSLSYWPSHPLVEGAVSITCEIVT